MEASHMNPMKASELMEELKTRLPDAPVYATEGRDLTIITSVRQNEPQSEDKTVLLIGEAFEPERWGRSRAYRMLVEAMLHGDHGRIFQPQISESRSNPGKLVVTIDGNNPISSEFDSEKEAMAYVQGFAMGFTAGGGIKNVADGLPSPP
jgi:hypothetical protein